MCAQMLVNLRAVKKEAVITTSMDQEMCSTHQEKMSVYCETCKTSICHECALWSTHHKQHSLDMIFKRNKQILEDEVRSVVSK